MADSRHSSLGTVCWITSLILTAFVCFTQLGIMLSLLANRVCIAAVAPVGLLLAVFLGDRLARANGLTGRARLWPSGLALSAIVLSAAVSAWYFDLSWDGQWYHQTGIYAIANDWNPLADPTRQFLSHLQLWVRHYPKGPWYVAAAIYKTTGSIECGKCVAWLAWAAMGLAVFAAALDCGLRRRYAAAIACVVALNPVVVSEWNTYLVDGIMIGFLVVVVAAVFSGFQRPRSVIVWVGGLATIASVNAKFTGLTFLCLVFLAGAVWCALHHRGWLLRYAGWAALALFLGVVPFGYNPYLTNAIHWRHPFYPVCGTAAFPARTPQAVEQHETPKNLLGHNRLFRLAYATFGRPGNAPYRNEPNAALMWPLTARPADLFYYRYHETRVAGFGPFFSGALLFALGVGVWLLFRAPQFRWRASLAALTILASLLISPHLWWPRYGPQLWLLPIVPAVFVLCDPRSRWARRAAWVLLAVLAVNAGIVAAVRMTWETNGTRTLRRQLTELSRPGTEIDICFRYFEIPVAERLKAWGVRYQIKSRNELRDANELMSVVEGYPGAVRYRVHPATVAQPGLAP